MITENIATHQYPGMRDGANKEKAKDGDTAWTRSLQNAINEKWFAHPLITYSNSFVIGSKYKAEINTTSTSEAAAQQHLSEKRSSALLISDSKYEQSSDRDIPAPNNVKFEDSNIHSNLIRPARVNSLPLQVKNANLPIWNINEEKYISDDINDHSVSTPSDRLNVESFKPSALSGLPLSSFDFNSATKSFIISGNDDLLHSPQWHLDFSSDVQMNFIPLELNSAMTAREFVSLTNVQRLENSMLTGIQSVPVSQSAESELRTEKKVNLQRDVNFSRPKNPPIRMHIENHEDGAKVWIGCDRISDNQRNSLIERVQSMLLYYGHPVESIVINGTPVALQEARLKTKSRASNHTDTELKTQNSNFFQATEVIRRYSENSEAK